MWDYVDKELSSYNKQYDKINRKTLDEFQSILDNDKDLEEDATRSDFNRLKRAIEDNYEYLSEYGKYEVRKCLKRRRIKYKYWFWFYFFIIYSSQAYMLAMVEDIIFQNVVREAYFKEIDNLAKDITPKKKSVLRLSDKLVSEANSKGYIWSEYKDAMVLNNTNELYSLFTLQKRANKPLNVDNKAFKKLFEKQKNRIINVNGNKTSGAMDNELIYLANSAKLKAYEDNDIEKCRFIAIHDSKTTEMCRSLEGQVFNVHDWNEFKRYSATNQTIRKYRVYGLIPGVNLPPIDDHFHYCRSTITYLTALSNEQVLNITNKDAFVEKVPKDKIRETLEIYENDIRNRKKEYMVAITPEGYVYYFKGTPSNVKDKGIDIENAIITHNHPFNKEDNMYQSFGEDDFMFIKTRKFKELRVVTPEFTDIIHKRKEIDEGYNYFHIKALDKIKENSTLDIQKEATKIMEKEGYIDYERIKMSSL